MPSWCVSSGWLFYSPCNSDVQNGHRTAAEGISDAQYSQFFVTTAAGLILFICLTTRKIASDTIRKSMIEFMNKP